MYRIFPRFQFSEYLLNSDLVDSWIFIRTTLLNQIKKNQLKGVICSQISISISPAAILTKYLAYKLLIQGCIVAIVAIMFGILENNAT